MKIYHPWFIPILAVTKKCVIYDCCMNESYKGLDIYEPRVHTQEHIRDNIKVILA